MEVSPVKKSKKIHSIWEINGTVVIRISEGGDRYIKIYREKDLDDIFSDFIYPEN